jgi:hypothetical protein
MIARVHSVGENIVYFLFLAGIVVIGIVSSIRQNRARGQRLKDMAILAERLGFDDFNPDRDESFILGWGFLDRFNGGEDRYAFNLMRGIYHDQRLFVFDYHYQTGSGKSRQEHYCTLLMLVIKEAFPQLTIGPETLGQKIETALGLGDVIKFESAEFSRKFCVRSKDKKFAYDVCNAQMIDYLLANRDLAMEIQGPVILLAFEPQLPVAQIEFNLQRLIEIRSRLPEYLFTNS